jgi:enamine deaminase RidA (YjgF/YER057c/UK114 family)
MPRRNVSSGSPYEKPIGFSRASMVGSYIAVSGTAPIGPDGSTVGVGDAYVQAKKCLEIIGKALNDLGAGFRDVIRTRIFLTNVEEWEKIARAHGEVFGEVRPASTFVQVKGLLNPEWLVEIEADAVISEEE